MVKMIDSASAADPFPQTWRSIVAHWAIGKERIWEVHLFGSRAKGNHVPGSDADIAVLLLGDDPGETLAYAMFEADSWEAELQKLLPVTVDLQFADRDSDRVVWPSVREHGQLLYRKRDYVDAAKF